jgi:hypothetical protein
LNPACPVKFFVENERSGFNRGTHEPYADTFFYSIRSFIDAGKNSSKEG